VTIRSRGHRLLRGPVRTRLRAAQARHEPSWAARRPGPPDFVGIGAQRCGTSWWHSLIEQHPRVAPLGLGAKELHWFDGHWQREPDPAAYAAHFRRREGEVAGEWTPRYLFDPWAVPALLRVAPEARLIVMLRDPVARLRSGLRHEAKVRGRIDVDAVNASVRRGMYAEQLAPVLAAVDRDRLLVLQLEQCVRDVRLHLERTFAFLGLEPCPVDLSGRRNESQPLVEVPETLLELTRPAYRRDAQRLVDLVGDDVDVQLWDELGSD
jgi:hypothetical protein